MVAVGLQCQESNNPSHREDSLLSPNWGVQLSHPKQIRCSVGAIPELEGDSFIWLLVHQYHHLKPKIFINSSWVFSCWCILSSYMFYGFVSLLLSLALWQSIISFHVSALSHPCGYLSPLPKTAELWLTLMYAVCIWSKCQKMLKYLKLLKHVHCIQEENSKGNLGLWLTFPKYAESPKILCPNLCRE